MHRVFVYGTLKQNFYNHHILQATSAEFLRTAVTVTSFHLFLDRYSIPYAVLSSSSSSSSSTTSSSSSSSSTNNSLNNSLTPAPLTGELYNVTNNCLKKLDYLEGIHEGRYQRKEIQLIGGDEKEKEKKCWIYLLSTLPEVTGDQHLHFIKEYTEILHQDYVPPGPGRDLSTKKDWGGFE